MICLTDRLATFSAVGTTTEYLPDHTTHQRRRLVEPRSCGLKRKFQSELYRKRKCRVSPKQRIALTFEHTHTHKKRSEASNLLDCV